MGGWLPDAAFAQGNRLFPCGTLCEACPPVAPASCTGLDFLNQDCMQKLFCENDTATASRFRLCRDFGLHFTHAP
ncbi:hypothetical protein CFR74_07960 [Novacetimonas hansenii]|nr:hypothetical protein CFR74_07960 [Novacetimonas hansenii]